MAHELLFRTVGSTSADVTDADRATAEVLISAFTDIGLQELVGDHPAFVNVPYGFLVDGLCSILPRDRVVLEILEDVPVDDRVVATVRQLVDDGYSVALDDFEFRPELRPLVELADIIKVDVLALTGDDLARTLDRLHRHPARLLAEKIEDREQLPALLDAGFELFQGYGLDRPRVVSTARRAVMLQVMSELHRPDLEIADVVDIVSRDPSLAYALLRIVNSASMTRGSRISSLQHAVVLLGIAALRDWATLLLMTRVAAGSTSAMTAALVRAKLSERVAESMGMSGAVGFTLGMLSALPDILGEPMAAILDRLSLEPDVELALLEHSGPYGPVLACVSAYERGDRPALVALGGSASLADAYLESTAWAHRISATIGAAAVGASPDATSVGGRRG